MKGWGFLEVHGLGVLEQLWVEEWLLGARASAWPWAGAVVVNAPFLRPDRSWFAARVAVVGVAQRAAEVLRPAAAADGLPVVQRYSAGGAVVVGRRGALLASVLGGDAALAAAGLPAYPAQLFELAAPVLVAPWAPLARVAACGYDYVVGERKVGGIAQRVVRDGWAHHASFLWRADVAAMQRYLAPPPRQPEYRRGRDHADFVTDVLREADSPAPLDDAAAARALCDRIAAAAALALRPPPLHRASPRELADVLAALPMPADFAPRSGLLDGAVGPDGDVLWTPRPVDPLWRSRVLNSLRSLA